MVAEAGFRAIAPDMRGYGETDAPPNAEDYTQELICADMVALLDALEIDSAVFVGHDWGGADGLETRPSIIPPAAAPSPGINTPAGRRPPINPLDAMKMDPGRFDYQLYFQDEGVAEAELGGNVRRTMTLMLRTSKPEDRLDVIGMTSGVRERGGLLVGLPDDAERSIMLTEEDLDTFVRAYEKTGFRGGLNWYRNHGRNWEWGAAVDGQDILQPALMVTAGKDGVLLPSMSEGMEGLDPQPLQRSHRKTVATGPSKKSPRS